MTSASQNPNSTTPPQHSASPLVNAASPPSKRDLKSWWKGFKLPSKHQEANEPRPQGIFGVPLRQSITYANVAISLIDENGQSYIYGYVPIVVAKCGVFLKEKATGVEGIFRLAGSEKRIKELKTLFDSPDRYGKGLVWDGFTVHDAANVLRRYLNDLPEPVVPLDLYEKFRDPLRGATKQAVGDAEGPQFVESFDEKTAIETYQRLITELPPLNRQLLLYILDLLAVFAAKADENRMNSQNLAAIFQPGMLSHPAHAMAPEEYRLNQCVIIFLIENQDHFLIGMQGTATDEKTIKEVQSGTPAAPVTPNSKRHSGLRRSASNASAGAESVRRDGMVRRNRSVSSRNSKHDGSTTPNSPTVATTPTGGLGRSNTVPSKKSPALAGGKFRKPESPGHPRTSAHLEPLTQAYPVDTPNQSENSSLAPAIVAPSNPSPEPSAPGRSQERLLEVLHEITTPHKERNLPSLFQRSPADGADKRQPNKLKKKRIPGSLNPSAQSSSTSLPHSQANAHSPIVEVANPMETVRQEEGEQQHPPTTLAQQHSDVSSEPTPRASHVPVTGSLHPEAAVKAKSPPASVHSSFNEGSDVDQSGEEQFSVPSDQPEKERKRRWRLSRARKEDNGHPEGSSVASNRLHIGSNDHGDISTSSIGSGANRPRKSFTGDSSEHGLANTETTTTHDSGRDSRDEAKGPIGWIRNKYREAKENAEYRRNKSPPADRLGPSNSIISPRGKSLDIRRDTREEEKESAPPQTAPSPAAPPPAAPPPAAPSPAAPSQQPQPVINAVAPKPEQPPPVLEPQQQVSPPPQPQQQQQQAPSQQQQPPHQQQQQQQQQQPEVSKQE